jgi:hypothetical protein
MLIRFPGGAGSPVGFPAVLYYVQPYPSELSNLINVRALAATRQPLERLLDVAARVPGPDSMPVYEGIVDMRPKY